MRKEYWVQIFFVLAGGVFVLLLTMGLYQLCRLIIGF